MRLRCNGSEGGVESRLVKQPGVESRRTQSRRSGREHGHGNNGNVRTSVIWGTNMKRLDFTQYC